MHNYLGQFVGFHFSLDELEDEFYDETDSLEEVYVAEIEGKVVGYISFAHKIIEGEWCGR